MSPLRNCTDKAEESLFQHTGSRHRSEATTEKQPSICTWKLMPTCDTGWAHIEASAHSAVAVYKKGVCLSSLHRRTLSSLVAYNDKNLKFKHCSVSKWWKDMWFEMQLTSGAVHYLATYISAVYYQGRLSLNLRCRRSSKIAFSREECYRTVTVMPCLALFPWTALRNCDVFSNLVVAEWP